MPLVSGGFPWVWVANARFMTNLQSKAAAVSKTVMGRGASDETSAAKGREMAPALARSGFSEVRERCP
jgi:hypothetical protein